MSFNSENLAKLDISALRSQRWYAPDTIRAFAPSSTQSAKWLEPRRIHGQASDRDHQYLE